MGFKNVLKYYLIFFLAFVGKFDIEFLIVFLLLHPAVPRVAPIIDVRHAPACSAKSSPTLLAAPFAPFEIASGIFDSGFESDDGVSSVFFLLLFVVRCYIFTLLLLYISCKRD